MLCYFCPLLCCVSLLSSARVMSYVLLIINSRHDMFRWLSELCGTVTMASDISLIIRSLCSILHEMSCWISVLAVIRFTDYHSSVLLLPWREIIHWLSEPCHNLVMTSYHSLNTTVAKPNIFPFGLNTAIEFKSVTTAPDSTAKTVSWDTTCRRR